MKPAFAVLLLLLSACVTVNNVQPNPSASPSPSASAKPATGASASATPASSSAEPLSAFAAEFQKGCFPNLAPQYKANFGRLFTASAPLTVDQFSQEVCDCLIGKMDAKVKQDPTVTTTWKTDKAASDAFIGQASAACIKVDIPAKYPGLEAILNQPAS